jgi:hypothetical protein
MKEKYKNKIMKLCEDNNLSFCSSDYIDSKTKYLFSCNACNKHFDRLYSNILSNQSCPHCNKSNLNQYNKLNLDYWVSFVKNKNLLIISTLYKDARSPLHFKCTVCQAEFHNSPCNIKSGSGCPKCANKLSKPEKETREIFESIFGKPFPSVRPDFLKNPKSGVNLELDGFCEELMIAFEYDGEFHYKENPFRKNGLKKQQEIDKIKNELCVKNNITLYRVPYLHKNNLKEYINSIIIYRIYKIRRINEC